MIRELIKKGRLENSIYEFQNLVNKVHNKSLKRRIQRTSEMLSHNYNLTKYQYSIGILNAEDWNVFQAKIANSILDILEELNEESGSLEKETNDAIIFSRIIINSEICCWVNRAIDKNIENPIYDFHEQMNSQELKNKIIDPIFDITLMNQSSEPLIINHIGINPISIRNDIKGLPISGRIKITEGYILQMREFILGKDELLRIDNPIYMESKAPFRFTLQLKDFKQVTKEEGNDSVMKIVIGANNRRIESPLIKMGMY